MISMIVGRLHVMTPDLAVVRYVLSRMKGKRKAFLKLERDQRRAIIGEILSCHHRNRKTYCDVMSGNLYSYRG